MPEWYYDEDEWCGEEDFPFKGLDTKYIKTVVFRINKKNLRGIKVLDFINKQKKTPSKLGVAKFGWGVVHSG